MSKQFQVAKTFITLVFKCLIPRFTSHPFIFCLGLVLSVCLAMASAAQAQKQASCTFSFFGLGVNIPNLGPGFITPSGINDFGTIVGTAVPSNDQEPSVAFVRWANGGYSFPLGTSSITPSALVDRNDDGTSIG